MSIARKLGWFICGLLVAVAVLALSRGSAPAQASAPSQADKPKAAPQAGATAKPEIEPVTVNQSDVEWLVMVPQLGKFSPTRALLHEHPQNHSSQFLIRMPPNFHVPAHFHSANETHTVIEGTFIIQVRGQERVALTPGGFNFTPARVVHEAWTPPDKGALIFVTIDGQYDLLQEQAEMQQPAGAKK